jgi:diguanylate cyclase (GGDEF)-like protein/PAS domain S-box-containing protein
MKKLTIANFPLSALTRSFLVKGKRLQSYQLIPAFTVLVLGVVWVSTAFLIKSERTSAERAAGRLTQELLATYEAQATRALREIDQTLKLVKYAKDIKTSQFSLADLKAKGLLPPDLIFSVSVTDETGEFTASSRPTTPEAHVEKDFLDSLQQSDAIAVSRPLKGAAGTDMRLQFGRKLTTPEGSFTGAVIVSVAADYFVSGYESAKLGSHGVLAILGTDGVFRARRTGETTSFGDAVDYASAAPDANTDSVAVKVVINPWDKVPRYTSALKLFNFPLTIIVGLSEEEQLATHRKKANAYMGWAAAGSFLLVMFALVVGTLGWRLEMSRRRAIEDRKVNDQNLRVAAAAFESQEAMIITDASSVILQVNEAFKAATGYTASEVLGKTPRLIRSDRQDETFYSAMWDTIERQGVWKGELWNRHKDGTEFPVWSTISAVKNTEGEVTHYVGSHFDITARKHAEKRINDLAYFDQLTGLPNRTLLMERLTGRMISPNDASYSAMLFIDLDNFKKLNDTLGHDMGDELLRQVAKRLTSTVRADDTVARLGGDEFVIMLIGLDAQRAVAKTLTETIGEKIRLAVSRPYQLNGTTYHCSSSIGATLFKGALLSFEDLMKQSDLAMYRSKAAGRNSFSFFEPMMEAAALASAALENDLREAIDKGQLELHYQAQVVESGQLTGAEALVRWNHPTRGMVAPIEFIPLAEETGLIQPLGNWVLETACAQLVQWAQLPAMAHLTLAVNVSARQFHQSDFVHQVIAAMRRTGANPNQLKLELTESLLLDNVDHVIEKMSALKAEGVGFSLDDFGTGYSSLSYLKRLPLDQLKIDKSFVRDVHSDPDDAAIVKAIVTLGHALNLSVIAEGVETAHQLDFLIGAGCSAFQGYYFNRPMPHAAFEAYAQQHLPTALA